MYHNVLDEPSPLGLRLKKSPSLLDLIQMRLSQASNAGESSMDNSGSEPSKKKDNKSSASAAGERLKASNFPANILKIGSWEVREFIFAVLLITQPLTEPSLFALIRTLLHSHFTWKAQCW